jgi:nucleotide-binding universal stress UspA family protein
MAMLTTINTILYATDLGKDMQSSLNMAISLADKYQAKVTVLNVIEPINTSVYNWGSAEMWGEIQENSFENAKRVAAEQVDNFFAKELADGGEIARPTIKVINGNVTQSLLDLSEEINADIIVMGSHGYSALGELLLGSVADKVMRLSKRPVLLVPSENN